MPTWDITNVEIEDNEVIATIKQDGKLSQVTMKILIDQVDWMQYEKVEGVWSWVSDLKSEFWQERRTAIINHIS